MHRLWLLALIAAAAAGCGDESREETGTDADADGDADGDADADADGDGDPGIECAAAPMAFDALPAIVDVWEAATGEAIAVGGAVFVGDARIGEGGPAVALRRVGGAWSETDVGSAVGLSAVWGAAPDDVLAAGGRWEGDDWIAELWRYDGVAWALAGSLEGIQILDLHGTAADDVYAVGNRVERAGMATIYSNSVALRFDGSEWSVIRDEIGSGLRAVYAAPTGEVLAGGDGELLIWAGDAWNDMTGSIAWSDGFAGTAAFSALHGLAYEEVFAVGVRSDGAATILAFDGVAFTEAHAIPAAAGARLGGVHAAAADDVLAVGVYGGGGAGSAFALAWDGAAWTETELVAWSEGAPARFALAGAGPGDAIAAGGDPAALILELAGGVWGEALHEESWPPLRDVWGEPGEAAVYAVGEAGWIVRSQDGGAWSRMETETTADLNGVSGYAGFCAFAVGDGGTLLSLGADGAWSAIDLGTEDDLLDVWVDEECGAYIVGEGPIRRFEDGETQEWENPIDAPLTGITGAGIDYLFAVGGSSVIYREGTAWYVAHAAAEPLADVVVSASGIVVAAGPTGAIAIRSAGEWSESISDADRSFSAAWGVQTDSIFLWDLAEEDMGGSLLLLDATAPEPALEPMLVDTSARHEAMWGISGAAIYAVGAVDWSSGAALRIVCAAADG